MKKLEALIFDVDGTLADTERDGHRVAFNRAFAEAGLEVHWDEELYGRLLAVTGGKERMRYYVEIHPDAPRLSDEEIKSLHKEKTRHYVNLLHEGAIPLRPGVARLMREAREQDMRLAIATTTTPANVEALITATLGQEALGWFEAIGAGDIVPAKKPAPDIYHWVLREMDLAPEAALALEDSEHGLSAAKAAELQCVVSVNGYTQGQDFTGALAVVEHLGEKGHPAQVLAGVNAGQSVVVDLECLRQWFA